MEQKDYSFVHAKDCNTVSLDKKDQKDSLLVVGVRKGIKYTAKKFPLRVAARNIIKKLVHLKESLEGQKVVLHYKNNKIKLVNCHLSFAADPSVRRKQLIKILRKEGKVGKRIICGDFNDFGTPSLNWFVGFLFNFKSKDYKIDEEESFKRFYNKYKLNNLFSGKATHRSTKNQLDHILVSKGVGFKNNKTLKGGIKYSDHFPLLVDLDLD